MTNAERDALYQDLNEDEQALLDCLLRRLHMGRGVYGPLSIASDQRNFMKEALEERVDESLYGGAAWLKIIRRAGA